MNPSEKWMGFLCAVLGGALLIIAGAINLILGFAVLVLGHGPRVLPFFGVALVYIVFGCVALLFAGWGWARTGPAPVSGPGIVLIILAVVGWFLLGLTHGVLPLIGSVFILIGGVLYLIARA